jgi:hypothetical protein
MRFSGSDPRSIGIELCGFWFEKRPSDTAMRKFGNLSRDLGVSLKLYSSQLFSG